MARIEAIDLMHMNVPGAIAAWVVEGPDGWVLIESGPASCHDALRAGLERLGIKPRDLAALLLTHIHLDHAGGAWRFAQAGVPVHVHHIGVGHLVDPSRLERSSRRIFGQRFDTLWGSLEPCPEQHVHAIGDGDVVQAAGLAFMAVETPGHAAHHHAWHLLDSEDLFSGDAAAMRVPGTAWITIPMPPPEFDLDGWMTTIDRLGDGPWRRFRLTHGGTVRDIPEHLAQLRTSMRAQVSWIQATHADDPARGEAYRAMLHEAAAAHEVPEALFRAHVTPGLVQMNLSGVDRWAGQR